MNPLQALGGATLLLAVGIWLLLPRGRAAATFGTARALGAVLAAAGLGLLASLVIRFNPEHAVAESVFLLLAVMTIVSALGAVTMRSPVYCAIWFALTLLGTAGLFLYQGAQFLGVATVVVYAGAILVTFLFVLMLAQPKGQTSYDRVSWEALLSASTGALLVGLLSTVMFVPRANGEMTRASLGEDRFIDRHADQITGDERDAKILHPDHMAHLGRELFSRHLLAVEVAGTLLLIALVGAIAIVAQGKQAQRWREEHGHDGGKGHG